MCKFKNGDTITARERGMGFEEATVLKTFISKEKRTKGKKMYLLKIICGTATMPVEAEVNYKLIKK